ncbi:tyrosine-type recombinase/integrase [Sulfitobacter guttiformis]|uniref:Integrase/recombinase XerD n=1 Tax=Sulfitobacter guttiformis TaxID=74349 RepID=A0A420DUD3_9RHOB|nr:tyrosine-type recombinase/integrase [Sulfitobacter guttiformis]KIN71443.1 Integrase [Sulfitobacter guttiformis KCTC 32187]RKE97886.1 integrase/recombinase XerD [Sulfitobacter guttiformis]
MRQAQTLNEAQLRRVLHYCRSRRHPVRDETIVMVSFYAGLRAKEIAALTVGNVFDEAGAVRSQFILSAEQSKGGKTRTVYLNQRLRKSLSEYGETIRSADQNSPLFESQKGGHFSGNTMCQLFLDVYKACGLKDASSHSGRRTYITRLANKGVGVRLLAELAGHSHISTTQRYIDVNSEQLSQAVELL